MIPGILQILGGKLIIMSKLKQIKPGWISHRQLKENVLNALSKYPVTSMY